jgi:hypothetical protein
LAKDGENILAQGNANNTMNPTPSSLA